MYQDNQKYHRSMKFLSAICGGLLIMPTIFQTAVAQQTPTSTPKTNPCPRIFYEEPHNSRVVVPQGCPPNALTQRLATQGLTPLPSGQQMNTNVGSEVPTLPREQSLTPNNTVIPSPAEQQAPTTTIALNNGRVNIRLVNNTAANITYQVIGDTAPRSLTGKSDVMLQNLSAPVTVTFQRPDGGLLMVSSQNSTSGMLELSFTETTDLRMDVKAMRIEDNGNVFLN